MRYFYTLRCPAPFWLIQCKPYQNRFIIAKVIDKSLGARFIMAHCVVGLTLLSRGLGSLLRCIVLSTVLFTLAPLVCLSVCQCIARLHAGARTCQSFHFVRWSIDGCEIHCNCRHAAGHLPHSDV